MTYQLPPAPGEFITIQGLSLHYIEDGPTDGSDAPPLLLIHGCMGCTDNYEQARKRLAQRLRVYLLDLPGFGYSEKCDDFSMNFADQAEVVSRFIKAMGMEKCTVGGHSMGGGIAIVLASRHANLVERLILIDSVAYPFNMPLKGRLGSFPGLGWFLFNKVYNRKIFSEFIRGDVFHNASLATEESIDIMYAHFKTPTGRRASHRAVRATNDPAWLAAEIDHIQAPTLIVWGAEDRMNPISLAHRLAENIADSSQLIIDDCGHSPMSEKPDAFVDALLGFLFPP